MSGAGHGLLDILDGMSGVSRKQEVSAVLDDIETGLLERLEQQRPEPEKPSRRPVTLEDLKLVLEKVKMNGKNLTALCPMHADESPSFSASVGKEQDLVVHCFAGCPQDQLLEHIVELVHS